MKKKARHEKIGLVLPGGGARGAYQAGVLKAFLEILDILLDGDA
jgi:predicted acylesterase/phospholipase RssA